MHVGNIGNTESLTDSEMLKLYKEHMHHGTGEVQLTDQRQKYEIFRAAENAKDLAELQYVENYIVEEENDQKKEDEGLSLITSSKS